MHVIELLIRVMLSYEYKILIKELMGVYKIFARRPIIEFPKKSSVQSNALQEVVR